MIAALYNLMTDQRYRFALVVFLALVVIFTKLEGNGLATWDDCFYAQKAKEINETGSWMTLHYAGEPAFENPPFFIWLIALSYKIWGINEYAAIFPSALFGLLSIVLIYFFTKYIFDSWTAFFSSFVLTTTFYFTKYARHAMIDVTLSFFVTLALFALVLALRRDKRYFILWGLAISVCVLLKSILGFFPALITVVYLLASGQWKIIFNKWFLFGSGIVLTLGCSWYIHQYITFGNLFINVHFKWLILQRGFNLPAEPWYAHLSYLKDLFFMYWPWVPVLVWGLYQFIRLTLKKDHNALLLLLWIFIIVIVMSLTQSRMFWYIMPIFPAAAIICGYVLNGWLTDTGKINFTPVRLSSIRERDIRTIAPYVKYLASQKAKVTGFGYSYYSLNNPLLFYSDHAANPIYNSFKEFSNQFLANQPLICIVNADRLDSVLTNLSSVYIIRSTDGTTLIANKPYDVSGVRTW